MSAHVRIIGLLALGVLLALPSRAPAQETNAPPIPVVEVSAGYMLMRDTEANESYPGGWYVSGGANLTRWFGVVGEAGGSYKKFEFDSAGPINSDRRQLYTFLGGPRFFYQVGRIVPFGQVLVGSAHRRSKLDFGRPVNGMMMLNRSETDVALQPGGGVTIYLSDRVGLRLAGDLRWLMDYSDDEWAIDREFRVMAGATFGWGAK